MKINSLNTVPSFKTAPAAKAVTSVNAASTAQSVPSFKAAPTAIEHNLAKGLGELAATKPVQKLVDYLKDKNYQRHIPAAVGVTLSSFYMLDTARSKKIESDQKLPLILNQGTVLAISTTGAYTINEFLDRKLDNLGQTFAIANMEDKKAQKALIKLSDNPEYINVLKRAPQLGALRERLRDEFEYTAKMAKTLKKESAKNPGDKGLSNVLEAVSKIDSKDVLKFDKAKEIFINNIKNSKILEKIYDRHAVKNAINIIAEGEKDLPEKLTGFKIAKSLVVFGLMYRFFTPVIATPLANKASKYIEEREKAAALQ